MSKELFYTSAPRGLDLGTSGFCTVAATQGLSSRLRERLHALSVYRHPFPPLDPRNPVVYSHLRLNDGGRTCHVLSRIADAPLDYSGRGNYFAHHVVLEAEELPDGGPAWLFQQPVFLERRWQGEPRWLREGRPVPTGDTSPGRCRLWEQLAGDAGWAGVLLQEFERDPARPAPLLVRPGIDALGLIAEALALLPPERRWDVTFSTYFLGVPPGMACAWRVVYKDNQEAERSGWLGGAVVFDLTAPLGRAPDSPLVECARSGRAAARMAVLPVDSGKIELPEPSLDPAPRALTPRDVPSFPSEEALRGQPSKSLWVFLLGLAVGTVLVGSIGLVFWFFGGGRDRFGQLEQKGKELETERDQSVDQGKNLQGQIATLRGKVDSLKKTLSEREDEIKIREQKGIKQEQEAKENEERLSAQVTAQTTTIGKLNANLKTEQERLEKVGGEAEARAKEVASRTKERDQLKTDLEGERKLLAERVEEVASLLIEQDKLKQDKEVKQKLLLERVAKVDSLQKDNKKTIAEYKKTLDELNQKRKELTTEKRESEKKAAKIDKLNKALAMKQDELESQEIMAWRRLHTRTRAEPKNYIVEMIAVAEWSNSFWADSIFGDFCLQQASACLERAKKVSKEIQENYEDTMADSAARNMVIALEKLLEPYRR
jgi:hypothetical protein